MKRSLLITIVVLLMAALFVSCNANKVEEDQLFEVTVDGGSRALSLSGTFEADAENLYWYYTATKTSGMFNNGTQTWKAVKAGKGLANTSLGDFSKGGWSFSFYGFTAEQATKPENPSTVAVFYQEGLTQTIYQAVVLNVTLARGTGALAAAEVSFAQMIKYAAAGASFGANDVVTLKVYDGTDLKVTKTGAIDSESNKYAFTFATTDTFTVADGAHTLHFVVYDQIDNDEPYIIGQSDITFTAKNGMKYVINDVSGIDIIDEQVGASTGSVTTPVLGTDTITASTTAPVVATVPNTPAGTTTVNTTVSFPAASFTGSPELAVETYSAEVASTKFNVTSSDAVVAGINLSLTQENGTAVTTFENTANEYVTVTTYIEKNLTDVKVLYNGSEYINGTSGDKYFVSYSAADGKLVFQTSHFSEFVVLATGAAKIGDKYYGTLDAAIAALQDGDTLTLTQNIDFSAERYVGYKWAGDTYNPLTITRSNVTIDLGGYTISNMGNVAICIGNILAADGRLENVTIKNGSLLAGQTSGVTNSYVLGIAGVDGAIIDGITTNGGINVYTGSENVEIINSTVNGTKYYTVCAQCGSHVTIKNSTLTKNTDSSVATKAMFWIDKAGTDSDSITAANPTGAYVDSSITLESGSYTVDTANGGVFYLSSGLKPIVTGGTFNIDPTDCVADGLKAVVNGAFWNVVPTEVTINNVEYTLAEAFSLADDEYTITLAKDVYSEYSSGPMLTVPAGKTITLDLNGHKLEGLATASKASALIRVEGTLTIVDSTDIDKNGTGNGKISLLASSPDDRAIPGYGSYTILNLGTLIVESGWIYNESEGGASFAIDNYSNNGKNIALTINGGKVTSAFAMSIRQAIFTNTTNDVIINGGVVGSYWIQNYGTSSKSAVGNLTINNVTALYNYRLDMGYSIDNGYSIKAENVIVKINGGSFKNITIYADDNANTKIIYGGTFPSLINKTWGYVYIENGEVYVENNDGSMGEKYDAPWDDPEYWEEQGYTLTYDSYYEDYTVKVDMPLSDVIGDYVAEEHAIVDNNDGTSTVATN